MAEADYEEILKVLQEYHVIGPDRCVCVWVWVCMCVWVRMCIEIRENIEAGDEP